MFEQDSPEYGDLVDAVQGELSQHRGVWAAERHDEDDECLEVRLQVHTFHDGASWNLHVGDASYDTDHKGFWGSGSLDAETDVQALAADLVEQALDHCAQDFDAQREYLRHKRDAGSFD